MPIFVKKQFKIYKKWKEVDHLQAHPDWAITTYLGPVKPVSTILYICTNLISWNKAVLVQTCLFISSDLA